MSLNDSTLKSLIVAEMAAVGFMPTEGNLKLAEAIAKAVVKHITASAEVVGGTCTPAGPIAGGKII